MGGEDGAPGGLLERDQELRRLDDALARSAAGEGAILTVEGPPGVGKSSLLRAARELAGKRAIEQLAANAGELERDLPFGVARQLLGVAGRVRNEEPTGSPEGYMAWVEGLHSELLDRIFPEPERDTAKPHLLVVDDAQWADEPSLRFLAHAALRLDDLPLVLLIAVRTGERSAPRELDALRSVPGAEFIFPGPLGIAAVRHLVHETCGPEADEGLAQACLGASGGNPFYLRELLHDLESLGPAATADAVREAAPESVLHAVLARLGHLGADHGALATAVVVLGDEVPIGTAAELAGLSVPAAEAAADDLAARHLLAPGAPLRIVHPLIASTLRADIGAFARARAHARAAEIRIREEAPAELVARHLLESSPGSHPDALRYLKRAAAVSRSRGAQRTAVRLLRRAVTESDGPDPELLLELAEALAESGDPEAIERLEAALDEISDSERRARALISLARLVHHSGDYAQAAKLAKRSEAELAPGHALRGKALAAFVASALLHPPLVDEGMSALDDLLGAPRRERASLEPALLALAAAYSSASGGDEELVCELAEHAFADHPLVDPDSRGTSLGFAAEALENVDALDLLGPLLERALDDAEARGALMATSIGMHYRARLNYHRGHLDQAVADAERSLETYHGGWARSAWSTPVLVRAHLARGDAEAARDAIAVGEGGDHERVEHALLLEARAAFELESGDAEAALSDARAAVAHVGENFRFLPLRTFDLPRLAALALHRLGEQQEAQELIQDRIDRLRELGTGRQLGTALWSAGRIAGGARGVELHTEAVEVLEGSPSRFELAEARIELGAAERRAGMRTKAEQTLLRGLELADECGAAPLVERTRSELGTLGLRPRRSARSGPASLTPGELRVAERAGRGLSTPQIAHELYITRKTVESHLTQVYRKLEIGGRGELAEALGAAASSDDSA